MDGEQEVEKKAFIIGRCAACGKIQAAWLDAGKGRAKIVYDMVKSGLKVEKVYAQYVKMDGACDHE